MQLGQYDQATVIAEAAYTADFNSEAVETKNVDELILYLNVTAGAADADETLDITLQDSPNGTDWYDVASFTQVTAATAKERKVVNDVGAHVRAVVTLAGTTPSFTFELIATGKNG